MLVGSVFSTAVSHPSIVSHFLGWAGLGWVGEFSFLLVWCGVAWYGVFVYSCFFAFVHRSFGSPVYCLFSFLLLRSFIGCVAALGILFETDRDWGENLGPSLGYTVLLFEPIDRIKGLGGFSFGSSKVRF